MRLNSSACRSSKAPTDLASPVIHARWRSWVRTSSPSVTQPLPTEMADRLQEPVARRVPALQLPSNDRLLDQRPEQLHDPLLRHALVGADVVGGGRIESAREHRQSSPEQLLCLVEQAVTPVRSWPRASADALQPPGSRSRGRTANRPSPSLSWSRLNAPRRTAASSRANGIPSRRRQSWSTGSAFSSLTRTRERRPRRARSAAGRPPSWRGSRAMRSSPSSGSDIGGTGILTSPTTPSACRLVARRCSPGMP